MCRQRWMLWVFSFAVVVTTIVVTAYVIYSRRAQPNPFAAEWVTRSAEKIYIHPHRDYGQIEISDPEVIRSIIDRLAKATPSSSGGISSRRLTPLVVFHTRWGYITVSIYSPMTDESVMEKILTNDWNDDHHYLVTDIPLVFKVDGATWICEGNPIADAIEDDLKRVGYKQSHDGIWRLNKKGDKVDRDITAEKKVSETD